MYDYLTVFIYAVFILIVFGMFIRDESVARETVFELNERDSRYGRIFPVLSMDTCSVANEAIRR